MTIHREDPFATPEPDRSAGRRLRGRLALPVTLWTAGALGAPGTPAAAPAPNPSSATRAAGLSVASVVVADGDPAHVLGLIDEESELWEALESTGVAVVTILTEADRALADVFGFVSPAPGGPFTTAQWRASTWGPVLELPRAWAGVRLVDARAVGYSLLIDTVVEKSELASESPAPLVLHRGRYLGAPSS